MKNIDINRWDCILNDNVNVHRSTDFSSGHVCHRALYCICFSKKNVGNLLYIELKISPIHDSTKAARHASEKFLLEKMGNGLVFYSWWCIADLLVTIFFVFRNIIYFLDLINCNSAQGFVSSPVHASIISSITTHELLEVIIFNQNPHQVISLV